MSPTMTKDEINRAVAEKICKWRSIVHSFLYQWGPEHTAWDSGPWWVDEKGQAQFRVLDWNPAERIDHAWMVVEKLKTRQFILERKYDRWGCDIQNKQGEWFVTEPVDTTPMAICLAALEAVKEE